MGVHLAVDRQQLQAALCRTVNCRAALNLSNFLTSQGTASLSKSTSLLVVSRSSSHHHHHYHLSFMEFSHLLTRSGVTYPEVSSKLYHDYFCQLGSSISLPWIIRETCQWLKFPLNGLLTQCRVSPAVGLLHLTSGRACLVLPSVYRVA